MKMQHSAGSGWKNIGTWQSNDYGNGPRAPHLLELGKGFHSFQYCDGSFIPAGFRIYSL